MDGGCKHDDDYRGNELDDLDSQDLRPSLPRTGLQVLHLPGRRSTTHGIATPLEQDPTITNRAAYATSPNRQTGDINLGTR